MSVLEISGGNDRRSMINRYERMPKMSAISELVDLIHCTWRQIELLEAERDQLKNPHNLNHNQVLAEAAARYLMNSGAENYAGEVFTVTLDNGTQTFEVIVTTQQPGAKAPHELHMEAVNQRDSLRTTLGDLQSAVRAFMQTDGLSVDGSSARNKALINLNEALSASAGPYSERRAST